MGTTESEKIAELLFPQVTKNLADLEKLYPPRDLPDGAVVSRFAPSPTGFLHIGNLLALFIAERLTHQTNGVFILRIEDTDKTREVPGGIDLIINSLKAFEIPLDEGMYSQTEERGVYGPYKQSERREIYAIAAKHLVAKGLAYPCFCTVEELDAIRIKQQEQKVKPGYYGKWAVHRNMSSKEVEAHMDKGDPFAIRIKAAGDGIKRIDIQDGIRGSVTFPENDQDYVLLKSDGLPTYHFAHPIDDHFMHVTYAIRADEWLPSTPLHLQIFAYFGWEPPRIGHISPLMKMAGTSRRKLSKRKDPESNVAFYLSEGYPADSVKEYLLTIANSNFEDWRRQNQPLPYTEFTLRVDKVSHSGALFDMVKLEDVSKQVIGRMQLEDIYQKGLAWAYIYDEDFAKLMEDNKDYTLRIFSIEKDQQGKRKDIARWGQLRETIGYFYDEEFSVLTANGYEIPENMHKEDMRKVLEAYQSLIHTMHEDRNVWFGHIKEIATDLGYTTDTKAYRQDPSAFRGYVGDVAMFLRIALANRQNTPDLQEIMRVMGEDRVRVRLQKALNFLEQ